MAKEVFSASSYGQTLTVHQNTPTPAYTSIRIESDDGQALTATMTGCWPISATVVRPCGIYTAAEPQP